MIRPPRLVQFSGAVGLVSWLSVGCSGDEQPVPAPTTNAAPAATAANSASETESDAGRPLRPAAPTCKDMQVRECRVELGAQGAVRNCFVGLQLCVAGKWGPCQDANEIESELSRN